MKNLIKIASIVLLFSITLFGLTNKASAAKLYVVSGDTNDIFKVGEKVFLSINEQDVKILND